MVVDSVLTPACRSKRASLGMGENGIAEEEKEEEEAEGGGLKAHGEAPQPLLANWGVANGAAYRLDLVVSPQILPSPLFFFLYFIPNTTHVRTSFGSLHPYTSVKKNRQRRRRRQRFRCSATTTHASARSARLMRF